MMPAASESDVRQWVIAAGFTGADIGTAMAVARAESGWNPRAVGGPNRNGTYDYGLFQINQIHNPTPAEKTDGAANARRAFQIYRSSGWKAWSAYNNGSYRQHLSVQQTDFIPGPSLPGLPGVPVPLPVPDGKGGKSLPELYGGGLFGGIGDLGGIIVRAYSASILVLTALLLFALGVYLVFRESGNKLLGKGAKVGLKVATKGLL